MGKGGFTGTTWEEGGYMGSTWKTAVYIERVSFSIVNSVQRDPES